MCQVDYVHLLAESILIFDIGIVLDVLNGFVLSGFCYLGIFSCFIMVYFSLIPDKRHSTGDVHFLLHLLF